MIMDFGLSFSYIFEDADWFKKIAIAALVSLIPIVGPFVVAGWGLQVTKNVIDGKLRNALPDLDFGADLGRGFMSFLIGFIYSLPGMIVMGIAVLPFVFADGVNEEWVRLILILVGVGLVLIGILFAILISFLTVIGIANYVAKGRFGAAFNLKEVFGMLKKSFGSWLLVFLGEILTMSIIAPLGTVVCFIGVFLTTAFAIAVYSHMIGQAYNQSQPATPVLGEMETL